MTVRGVNKLCVVGAGAVGSSLAYASLIKGVAREVVLYDVNGPKVRAEALDMAHGSQFMPQVRITGADDPEITRGSDVVVITAGAKQRPGETRMDLAASTVGLMKKVVPPLVERSPEAIFLMVTNPVDVTTYAALKISGLPRNQLFGSGTVLDSSRLRYLVAEACQVAVGNVHAYIAGEHGDSEIPLWSSATIGGVPLLDWARQYGVLDEEMRDTIADQVVNAAYEVIAGKGATNYAIGLAGTRIIESVLRNEHRVLPVSSLVDDWYGIKDVCLSVPTLVDRSGAGRQLRLPLTDGELGCMHESAQAIRYTLSTLGF
ncbi:L-lactate dehydrogenase [Arachnia propionica]|uniref:L-lactate dehydrogenase n=1 Tax=Arachnia propionica TaxID=1750 RepID=A0A3P1TAJ5_9ACTN|nr:L-lactate dehydrogenase [Arachnia propionica]MDO5083237.1 L-lactate dehydrogenase [Arachnia propionica]RRD05483.1 L-lactate dehydrogenase [Arachnia propionica]